MFFILKRQTDIYLWYNKTDKEENGDLIILFLKNGLLNEKERCRDDLGLDKV